MLPNRSLLAAKDECEPPHPGEFSIYRHRAQDALYRAFIADPANAVIFVNPPFPREVASDEEHST